MTLSPLSRGTVTLIVGAAGGLAFFLLNLPLPWVLGSLAASAFVTQVSGFQPTLPPSWRSYSMVAIGNMLGTGFTQDVVARSGTWVFSPIAMSLLSVGFGVFAYVIFRHWGGMERNTALFAAMPGGLSVVSMLAEDYRTEVNRVVLCHTARLVVLLVSAPIVIQMISGIDLADANRAAYAHPEAIDPLNHSILALAAVVSWFIASRMRLPSAMLLLPLLTSALLHATGLLTVHVPLVLSTLAQIVIEASVGARFASYTMIQIFRDGWLAALVGIFLAYLPGGAPELGVVALALLIDPAMVAAHHVLRVFLIVAILPVLASWAGERKTRPF
ncbi:MAG: AbrB family transcriptional regulator [Rhodobacterales bacterium]